MTYEKAKMLLEQAITEVQRAEAVQSALRLGMPLYEIEEYLDWFDARRAAPRNRETSRRDESSD